MSEPLRVAIAGAGLMGRWHAYYARRCGAKVVGILDPDPDRARRLSGRYGARAFSDLSVMLRELRPAVLHICTPSASHVEIARAAMEAGVHALVEKPFGMSAPECENLLDRASLCGVRICPVHQFVFQDGVELASAWLSSLGEVLHLQAVVTSAGGGLSRGAALDQIAGEVLVHPLSIVASFWPDHLPQGNWSALRSAAGEIRAFGARNGISSAIVVSMNGRPSECSFHITASKGSVYIDLFHGFAVRAPAEVSRNRKIAHPFAAAAGALWSAGLNLAGRVVRREPAYPGLRRLITRFYGAVALGEHPPFSREEIIAVARARDEIIFASGLQPHLQSASGTN